MNIPIQNIYYLLSYAWNKWEESKIVRVAQIDCESLLELFAKVLSNGVYYLLRQGLDRNYLEVEEKTSFLRGKINFSTTLKSNFFRNPTVYCEYDELNHNVLHNQIIKTTIGRLIRSWDLNDEIHEDLTKIYRSLHEIDEIHLTKRHFGLVQLHGNNAFYAFLLNICELIHDAFIISQETGDRKFPDFLRDEKKMALLFEEFIRNFYRKEQSQFKVGRRDIKWDVTVVDNEALQYLPKMQTDVFLDSPDRKIIIDAKYYKETLNYYYDKEKIHSANLYQIAEYLDNIDSAGDEYKKCEGILLYPVVGGEYNFSFFKKEHRISVRTINLNQDWRHIHDDLLSIISP